MKLLIILGLAAVAAAASAPISPEIVRIGTVGVAIADVKGTLVPKGDSSPGVPMYEFKSMEPWASEAGQEGEQLKYRCNVITEYFNPKSTQPILLCRNSGFNKGTKQTFLFTHSGLDLAPSVKEIEIMVAKSTVANFAAMHSLEVPERRKKPAMEGVYDGYFLLESHKSLESLLDYKI